MSISKKIRDELLVEAGHRCTVCAEKCFEIHHIIEQSQGGSDEEENLIVLCPNCHQHRHHRHKEISTDQLRLYKQGLKEAKEIERRLLMNLDDLVQKINDTPLHDLNAELSAEINSAADKVCPDRSPLVHRKVTEVSTWLAEQDLIRGGARRAIEVEWEIQREEERRKFPRLSVVAVDTENMVRVTGRRELYKLRFDLSDEPTAEWSQAFDAAYKQSMYMMKRRTYVRGKQLVMEVGSQDNLQAHADWAKKLVADTDRLVQALVFPEIDRQINREKAAALAEYDAIQSLINRARDIDL